MQLVDNSNIAWTVLLLWVTAYQCCDFHWRVWYKENTVKVCYTQPMMSGSGSQICYLDPKCTQCTFDKIKLECLKGTSVSCPYCTQVTWCYTNVRSKTMPLYYGCTMNVYPERSYTLVTRPKMDCGYPGANFGPLWNTWYEDQVVVCSSRFFFSFSSERDMLATCFHVLVTNTCIDERQNNSHLTVSCPLLVLSFSSSQGNIPVHHSKTFVWQSSNNVAGKVLIVRTLCYHWIQSRSSFVRKFILNWGDG